MSGLWSFVSALLEEVAPTADEGGGTPLPATFSDVAPHAPTPTRELASTPPPRNRAGSSHNVRADTFAAGVTAYHAALAEDNILAATAAAVDLDAFTNAARGADATAAQADEVEQEMTRALVERLLPIIIDHISHADATFSKAPHTPPPPSLTASLPPQQQQQDTRMSDAMELWCEASWLSGAAGDAVAHAFLRHACELLSERVLESMRYVQLTSVSRHSLTF